MMNEAEKHLKKYASEDEVRIRIRTSAKLEIGPMFGAKSKSRGTRGVPRVPRASSKGPSVALGARIASCAPCTALRGSNLTLGFFSNIRNRRRPSGGPPRGSVNTT